MTTKESVLRQVAEMPDDVTLDEIQYHLYVRQVVEESRAELDAGEGISQEEVEKRLAK